MDILGVIREEGRVWGLVARRERKAATLCVGVRERRELYPNGSDDRENTQEEVGSSACPDQWQLPLQELGSHLLLPLREESML